MRPLHRHRQEVEGSFAIRAEEQTMKASTLAVYGRQCQIEWVGDEPLDLPDAVEKLLVDDELKDSRAGVRLLWATLLEVYPTEQALTVASYTYCGYLHLLWLPTLTVATYTYCGVLHLRWLHSLWLAYLLWPTYYGWRTAQAHSPPHAALAVAAPTVAIRPMTTLTAAALTVACCYCTYCVGAVPYSSVTYCAGGARGGGAQLSDRAAVP
jgi:hypothetical protein